MRKNIQILISFIISISLLVYVALSLNWSEVVRSIENVDLIWLSFSVFILIIHYILRAIRWRYLLQSDVDSEEISLKVLFDSIQLGNFGTYVLPLRAGEFIRPLFLSFKSRVSFTSGFASVIVERFFDLVAVLLCFGIFVGTHPDLPAWAKPGAYSLGLLAVLLFSFILIGSFAPKFCLDTVSFLLKPAPKFIADNIMALAKQGISATAVLRSAKSIIIIAIFTLLVWGSCFLLFFVFTKAFLPTFPPALPLGLLVIIALAVAAPSAPGFLGIYQTACVATFTIFGYSKELGGAFSIVTHALQYLLFIGYGIIVMCQSGISIKELIRDKTEDKKHQ